MVAFILRAGLALGQGNYALPVDREFNDYYEGANLSRVAFPIGGMGAGMYCLDGSGAMAHLSIFNSMDFYNQPVAFAAVRAATPESVSTRVLQGPLPAWKIFGEARSGAGLGGTGYGLPRFESIRFLARFPFAHFEFDEPEMPLDVRLTGWSPFIPLNADDSSLPVGALEYTFRNPTDDPLDVLFSWNVTNFMARRVLSMKNGFVLSRGEGREGEGFAFYTDADETLVDHGWFVGTWWDTMSVLWKNIESGQPALNPPLPGVAVGASLFVPFTLQPGEERTVRLLTAWYAPDSTLRVGHDRQVDMPRGCAFGKAPARGAARNQNPVAGYMGQGLVNTFNPHGDAATGRLTSPSFTITGQYIQFLIGGGAIHGKTCMNLLHNGRVVRTAIGRNAEELTLRTWDVSEWLGQKVQIEIVDASAGGWGHINVDHIIMSDHRFDDLFETFHRVSGADVQKMLDRRIDENGLMRGSAILVAAPEAYDLTTVLIQTPVDVLHDFEGPDYADWLVAGAIPVEDPPPDPDNQYHSAWYGRKFASIAEVTAYWSKQYERLRDQSTRFSEAFHDSTLPPEVLEAITANLTILKTPTLLRQQDGLLWGWEGCYDDEGCCHGTCTHVWNYVLPIAHLFPELERGFRETEFFVSQNMLGHQNFRTSLPIRPGNHRFYAAADGQLGGIMQVHREWRISGDTDWLRKIWPRVKQSLEYGINTWDPRRKGIIEEPHHNTYDIEFWGPNGHSTSFYLGALQAAANMGRFLGEDVSRYETLLERGRSYMEERLFNGEYFFQETRWTDLQAPFIPIPEHANGPGYVELIRQINQQGPKYQYGTGCLSDGVLGFWLARVCGIGDDLVAPEKIRSTLQAIHRYNLRKNLFNHVNPQRPSYAVGHDGGLLLCSWPRGGRPMLPFIYSDEVWTGIEYQVASHLLMMGFVDEGLEIVRLCRKRYDGTVRNPFNEYECGHWYSRAMSSYGLLEGLTGVRYDAVDGTLHIASRAGEDFRSFFITPTGYGSVGLEAGEPYVILRSGEIDIKRVIKDGEERPLVLRQEKPGGQEQSDD